MQQGEQAAVSLYEESMYAKLSIDNAAIGLGSVERICETFIERETCRT